MITEGRFKKLTHAQWLFHYREVMKQKEKEIDQTAEFFKIAKNMFDTLLDRLDMIGFMANPDLGAKVQEEKEKLKRQENKNSQGKDELETFFDEIKNSTPETLTLIREDKDNKSKFILPTKKRRKVGIEINNKAGD